MYISHIYEEECASVVFVCSLYISALLYLFLPHLT
jgi:hypothetical protein